VAFWRHLLLNASERKAVLRNDLVVVVAGPATHLLMTPLWAVLMYFVGEWMWPECAPLLCRGFDCVRDVANPFGHLPGVFVLKGAVQAEAWAMVWELCALAVKMNVLLFLFNVLVPMYPADGAKLLTVTLMYCCGAPPRLAALVLICCSTVSAIGLILYALWCCMESGGQGFSSIVACIMGWMGIMSLIEAYNIYNLREQQQLHLHPLFRTAQEQADDEQGTFQHINSASRDGQEPKFRCCLASCCGPPAIDVSDDDEDALPPGTGSPTDPRVREQRQGFLMNVEQQARSDVRAGRQLRR